MDRLRIFISSPGDVDEERRRAAIVIQRIRREFSRFFDVSAILWEYDPMLSSGHFQDVIEKPSNTDIVVLILWSRLGTALPPRYQGIDGRTPVTGTEWEFEDALAAKLKGGTPDLLVYRKTVPPHAAFADAGMLARAQEQWGLLQEFWLRHFVDKDGTFKAAFNSFSALDEFEHELEMHLRAMLRDRVTRRLHDEGKRPISWHSGSPYRGLSVFDPEHAAIFFGREKAEQELVELFAKRAGGGAAFVTVFGASGSGKSSLMRAGVIPTVESPGVVAGVVRWRRLIVTPAALGANPFLGLANAILDKDALPEVLPEAGSVGDAAYWAKQMRQQPAAAAAGIRATLAAAAKEAGLPGGDLPLHFFLLVDQMEEIFTAYDADTRTAFVALLEALAKSGAVWVGATMRSDFFPRVSESETLAALTAGDGGYALAAPRSPEIQRMIQQPAEAAGITFEVDPITGIGLDGELLEAATASPAALPLLEFTLDELYRQDIEKGGGSFLTFTSFKALGGLEGAIAARAEATVSALPDAITAALPGAIRSLVVVGDDNRVGARSAPAAELKATPQGAALTDALVAARLLVVGDGTVRVAHEALLRAWPRAAALIAEDMDLLRARARAEQAMARWKSEAEAADFLLPRGRALAEASELLAARRGELSPDLVRFIEASAAADEARRQAELAAERARAEAEAEAQRQKALAAAQQAEAAQRLAHRTRIAAGILGVLLLTAAGAGIYAYLQRNEAQHQHVAAQTSQSYVLTDASFAASDRNDFRLARLLALAALPADLAHPDKPYSVQAESALARTWGDDRLITILPPQAPAKAAPVTHAVNPNARGPKLAAILSTAIGSSTRTFSFSGHGGDHTLISGDGHALVYDADVNLVLDAPHTADKGAAVLDATGARMAQGEGSSVRLWDVAAKTSRLLPAGSDAVIRLGFSDDGRFLVAGGANGSVSLWSLPDGKRLEVPGVSGAVRDVLFSSDSKRALVMGEDGRAGLYDLAGGKEVAVLGNPSQESGDATSRALRQGIAFLAKFSDDGALVMTAINDRTVQLWDAATGAALGGPMVHDAAVQSFDFAKGNEELNVRLLDGRTYVWARRWRGEARVIAPHVTAIAASPNTAEVLVTDAGGLHVVDRNGRTLRTLLAGPGLTGGAWSPDGKSVVVTRGGTEVVVIPAAGGTARTIWQAPAGDKIGMADFTSGSGRVLVEDYRYLGMLIDPATAKQVATIGDGQETLFFLAHSDSIGATWKDGRAVIYDADGHATKLDTPKGFSIIGMSGNGDAGLVATVGIGSDAWFWDRKTGRQVGHVTGGNSLAATRVAFQPGPGGWIALADINQNILVWPWPKQGLPDIKARPSQTLLSHTGLITRLRVTAQGRLMSDGQDHRVILWDPLAGAPLARYENAADSRMSLDGKRALLIGTDGAVRLADLPPSGQALIDQARARFGAFTPEEQEHYHLTAAGAVQ